MERIREAVERVRSGNRPHERRCVDAPVKSPQQIELKAPRVAAQIPEINEIEASPARLHANRVVAFNGTDQRSRPYDMLRTQVLQSMAVAGWKILGMTSPTPGCGKTLTAVNLALSIARQSEQSVVLIDLDLQKPQVAAALGLSFSGAGVLDIVEGRAQLTQIAQSVRAGRQKITVYPTTPTTGSSELMASREMREFLQNVRKMYSSSTVIVDLPPILTSDDVIAILPHIDCVLLVTAVGQSRVAEIEECSRHLKSSPIVRVVVNKDTSPSANYSYY